MKSIILAKTGGMDRSEWLALRRDGIGGSDAAAVIGIGAYKSPYALWAEKMGALDPPLENERMRVGTYLEDYVARRFCEITGKKVRRLNAMLAHPEHAWMRANVDRMVIGEDAGLECKTTASYTTRRLLNGDEFPEPYYAQCVHYLAVTGCARWYLAVLVLGSDDPPRIYAMERDEGEIAALIGAEERFWHENVLGMTPPDVDGSPSTRDAQNQVYPGGGPDGVRLECHAAVTNYLALKAERDAIEREMSKQEQAIKEAMGNAETGFCGDARITWATRQRKSLDKDALEKLGAAEGLYKITTYRQFSIKPSF